MSFLSLSILPGEHYISWYVRQAQFQAYPEFKLFLSVSGVESTSLKAYDVIHESILGFLKSSPNQIKGMHENTLFPLWQLSIDKEVTPDDLLCGEFLNFHHAADEKTVFQFDRSWHSCSRCREEDVANYGSSYWHTKHQTPSLYKCYKHATILEKAYTPISDLRIGVLPHQVKGWQKLVNVENEDVRNWHNFISSMDEIAVTDPESIIGLKTKVQSELGVDQMSVHHCISYTDELTAKFELQLGVNLLSYLFKDYARVSNKGEPKILRSLFGRVGNPYKIRSPIFWLLLGYWLFPEELAIK